MISLTPEQIAYKEKTLQQLLANQARLEASLAQESRPDVLRSIEDQLQDIDEHAGRLQDELSGNIVFDEPIADELFMQAVKSLAKEKFFLAKKYIHKLETIEPFYPGIERLHHEAESGKASRRTRSIAQGTATSYPGTPLPGYIPPPDIPPEQLAAVEERLGEAEHEESANSFFQFHIVVSCLVLLVITCAMVGVGGVTMLQFLIG